MKKSLKTLFFTGLLALLLVRCAPTDTTQSSARGGDSGQQGGQAGFHRDVLKSYSAEFQIQFQGATSWSYQLKTRKSPQLREMTLHIEGLPKAQNPGDIRMVTDGVRTSMVGPGTDQECVQFPNNQGMDPTFLSPEALVSQPEFNSALRKVSASAGDTGPAVPGITLQHLHASNVSAGGWKNATIDIWQDASNGMLYQFSMLATGQDPFFGSGAGKLSARYQAGALDNQQIEAVAGCEINVHLPESASMLVRLPGMASFETKSSVDAIQQFFQSNLPGEGWNEAEAPAQNNGATVLSYRRDTETIEIHIDATDGGSKVKILFLKGK